MRPLLLGGLLLFLSLSGCPRELVLTSRTYLSSTGWTEELGLEGERGPWGVRAGIVLDGTGLSVASLEIQYQTASFALWGTAEFTPAGFSRGTVGTELHLTEFLGFSAEVVVDDAGFAGADFALWYEAGVEEGASGFTGLLELDREGAVVGQTLRFGLDFPPLSLESTARFDEAGFTALELHLEVIGEAAAVGISGNWAPEGLEGVAGSLSGTLDTLVASGEVSWMVDGDWVFTGALLFGDVLSFQGRVARVGGIYAGEAEVGAAWEHVGFRFGVGFETEGLRYTGDISFRGDNATAELRVALLPAGGWELELCLGLDVFPE